VDLQIGSLARAIRSLGGALIVTADNGNADEMYERDAKTGEPKRDAAGQPLVKTSHSLARVPCHVLAPAGSQLALDPRVPQPGLAHVAATVLHLMGWQAPEDYAPSLLA
jgi:2,3-bisphosphoglycerate-independent phosphoglycerate mutase